MPGLRVFGVRGEVPGPIRPCGLRSGGRPEQAQMQPLVVRRVLVDPTLNDLKHALSDEARFIPVIDL